MAVITLTVSIDIVEDGTEDVPSLLGEILGQPATLDVASYRFDAHIHGEGTQRGES